VSEPSYDADVIIIGGGPGGSALGGFLARDGIKTLIIEKDIHPRDHVGESLTPSTNLIFDKLGFLQKMNDAGFIHKPGTGWNAPRSPLWRFIEIWLFEYPIPGGP
jgi:1H-pyrrole-2-carbonyl-[peptidyl-carrier protein] chlorinase